MFSFASEARHQLVCETTILPFRRHTDYVSRKRGEYEPPGEKGERFLRTWGLTGLGILLTLYALFGLLTQSSFLKVLGSYPAADKTEEEKHVG